MNQKEQQDQPRYQLGQSVTYNWKGKRFRAKVKVIWQWVDCQCETCRHQATATRHYYLVRKIGRNRWVTEKQIER